MHLYGRREEPAACGKVLRKIEGRVTSFYDAVTCPKCREVAAAWQVLQAIEDADWKR